MPIHEEAIYERINTGTPIVAKRIDELVSLGLLSETAEPDGWKTHSISLTAKWKEVAEHLAKVEQILRR